MFFFFLVSFGFIAAWLGTMQSIKNPKKRRYFLFISAIVIMDAALTFAIINRDGAPFSLVDVIIFTVMNTILIVGLVYSNSEKFKKSENKYRLDSDRNLKEIKKLSIGILPCPNCKLKTIVQANALKTAQTCGECGKKFKAIANPWESWIISLVLITLIGSSFLAIDYSYLTLQQGRIVFWVGLTFLLIYTQIPKKLKQVEEEAAKAISPIDN